MIGAATKLTSQVALVPNNAMLKCLILTDLCFSCACEADYCCSNSRENNCLHASCWNFWHLDIVEHNVQANQDFHCWYVKHTSFPLSIVLPLCFFCSLPICRQSTTCTTIQYLSAYHNVYPFPAHWTLLSKVLVRALAVVGTAEGHICSLMPCGSPNLYLPLRLSSSCLVIEDPQVVSMAPSVMTLWEKPLSELIHEWSTVWK